MNGNVIRTITIRGTSEGLDKLQADLNKVAAAQQNVAVVSEQSAKRVLSLEDAWKRQTLRLDEAARAQANIARETKLADQALREGLATQAQHAQRLEQINQRYTTTTKATQEFGKQTGLARHELINLGRQAQDVGVSLASGQSPLMVLVQQGTQVADVFATSGGTVRGFFTQAIGFAGRFVASAAGMVTAVGSIAAALLYAASSADAANKAIDKVLSSGPGAASGLTRGSLGQIAQGAAGSGMNINEARDAALEFAKTGQIYEQNIRSATDATKLFAQAAGIDAADASKQLAKALVDPSQGAQDLNKQFRFLDATLLNHIRTLQSHGKLQEAQAALLAGLTPTLQKQANTVDFLTAAWRTADEAVIKFFNSLNKTIGLGGVDDLATQLDQAMQKLQAAQDAVGKAGDLGVGPRGMKALQDAAAAAETEVRRLERAMADLNKQTEDQRLQDLSNIADAFTRALIPSIEQVEKLTQAISYLEQAKAKGVGGPNADAALTIARAQLSIVTETAAVEERRAARLLEHGSLHNQTLSALRDQLNVAQAVGVTEQLSAQRRATINQLLDQGKTLQEATAIANAKQAIAEAQIIAAHLLRMEGLEDQLNIAKQITGIGQINAEHEAKINELLRQGLPLHYAIAEADKEREIALARVNAQAERQLQNLQNEGELLRANSELDKGRIRARQEYDKLIESGVSQEKAGQIAAQMTANARATENAKQVEADEQHSKSLKEQANADEQHSKSLKEQAKAEEEAARRAEQAIANIRTAADAWKLYTDEVISWSVAHDEAVKRVQATAEATEEAGVHMAVLAERAFWAAQALNKFIPFFNNATQFLEEARLFQSKQGGFSQFNPAGYTSTTSASSTALAAATAKYGPGGFERDPNDKLGIGFIPNAQGLAYQADPFGHNKAMEEQKAWIEETFGAVGMSEALDELTTATKANTDATQAQTDVLSPFYSSDPRRTHLGFRAFAGGGIMTSHGELPLKQYQGGGMATSPQVAVFGEGSTAEAYVPVPSGRIPVELKMPANNNQRPVNVTINVMGNADANTVAALKTTAFQQAQTMRRAMR